MARICQNGQRIREEATKVIDNSLNLKNYYLSFRPGTGIVTTGLFLVFGDNLFTEEGMDGQEKSFGQAKRQKREIRFTA